MLTLDDLADVKRMISIDMETTGIRTPFRKPSVVPIVEIILLLKSSVLPQIGHL